MSRFLTDEEVRKRVEDFGCIWIEESKYLGNRFPITTLDSEGYKVYTRLADILRGYGTRAFYKSNPYTIDNIKLWCEKNGKNFRLVEDQNYINAKTKLKFKCLKCGSIFESTWDDIHSGGGCIYCSGKQANETNSIYNLFPELIVYFKNEDDAKKVTRGSNKRVDLICPDCGHEKSLNPTDLVRRGFSCCNCNPNYGITRENKGMFNETIVERNKEEYKKEMTTLYIIKCFDDDESFFKIGITSRGLNRRFSSNKYIKYNYESLYEAYINLYDAAVIESKLHKLYERHSYTPLKRFGGWTECFSEINLDEIKRIIDEYKTEE